MKTIFAFITAIFFSVFGYAQMNTITTAVPFLMITPDARAGGMGETGVATTPDVYSMHWNPAKLAFADKKLSLGISYVPWMRSLIPDINLANISFYSKLDSNAAFGGSFRYFSMGNITFTNNTGTVLGQYRPNEFAFDACYSRRFAKYWSAGMSGRLIRSNLTNGITVAGHDTKTGTSFAVDLGVYYHDQERGKILGKKSTMMFGVAITNIGSKISYNDSNRSFIPINLRVGQGWIIHLDSKNDLAMQYEFNKLLVPTPNQSGSGSNVSVPQGMLQSFYDAPGGINEEIAEINMGMGLEYTYNKMFVLRTGYFYESEKKGNRQFVTFGAGIRYHIFGLDFAYLIPTNGQRSPLQNTLRFSLQFDIDKFRNKK